MTIPRRQFVKLTFVVAGAAVTGAAGVLASACSSSSDTDNPTPGTGDAATGTDASQPKADAATATDAAKEAATAELKCRDSISQNHGHKVTVPVADLGSTTSKTYSIIGTSPHDHQITLDAQDFANLKAGLSVKKTSTSSDTHDHEVTILCAAI